MFSFIRLSDAQLSRLERSREEVYFQSMIEDIRASFPALSRELDAERLSDAIDGLIRGAIESGNTERGSLALDLALRLRFGVAFESDPQYAFLFEVIQKTHALNLTQAQAAAMIFTVARAYQIAAIPIDQKARHAMSQAVAALTLTDLPSSAGTFVIDMSEFLRRLFPEKLKSFDLYNIDLLDWIRSIRETAKVRYRFFEPSQQAVVILVDFWLGQNAPDHLFYAWARPLPVTHSEGTVLVVDDSSRLAEKLLSDFKRWFVEAIYEKVPSLFSEIPDPGKIDFAALPPSETVFQYNEHPVMVDFRLSDEDYGKVGFDWMRVKESATHDTPYIDGEDGTLGIIMGAYGHGKENFSADKAQILLKREYISHPVNRSPRLKAQALRLSSYFVPMLNLFPPTPSVAAGMDKEAETQNDLLGFTLPKPKTSARLSLWADVKDRKPDKVVIRYNHRYLKVTGSHSNPARKISDTESEYSIHDPFELTPETIEATLKPLSDTVTVECMAPISEDTYLRVIAYAPNPMMCGELSVLANHDETRKTIQIALIRVLTEYEDNAAFLRYGGFKESEIVALTETLHQALILPMFETGVIREGKHYPLTLDLTQSSTFKKGGLFIKEGKIDSAAKNLGVILESIALNHFPEIANAFMVFAFDEATCDGSFGGADKLITEEQFIPDAALSKPGKQVYIGKELFTTIKYRQSILLFRNRNHQTLAHGFLHGLQLVHTHAESDQVIKAKEGKFIFPMFETDNMMSFNPEAKTLFRWQWKMMRENSKIKRDPHALSGDLRKDKALPHQETPEHKSLNPPNEVAR